MQLVFRFYDAGCVGKDDLVVLIIQDAEDAVAGCLDFGGSYSKLLAEEGIEQGGFARVGRTEDVYET